jgi:photosystem II stability/assembly factor-like uncharacterized protein
LSLPDGQALLITQFTMVDADHGWAVASVEGRSMDLILHTKDGGQTWQIVTPPEGTPEAGAPAKIAFASFLDAQHAWVVFHQSFPVGGVTPIWATVDGGASWTPSSALDTQGEVGSLPIFSVEHFQFGDATQGWLLLELDAGMGHSWVALYRSSDAGSTWQRIQEPPGDGEEGDLHYCCRSGLDFLPDGTGMIAFSPGPIPEVFINWTDDGGLTFSAQDLPSPPGDPGLFADNAPFCATYYPHLFPGGKALVVVGCLDEEYETFAQAFLYQSADGGQHWQIHPYPGGEALFLTPQTGWSLGATLQRTLDGGATWERMGPGNTLAFISFLEPDIGYCVKDLPAGQALMRTEDGGASWQPVQTTINP